VLQPLGGVSQSSSSVEFRMILVENAVERKIVLQETVTLRDFEDTQD
jgi:hypothetical protein